MNVLIENYRGFEIKFDTDKENFISDAEGIDWRTIKKSYSSAKKAIDDYIKDNSQFQPFDVQREGSYYADKGYVKITGIRKDGKFAGVYSNGEKKIISDYEEKDWFLVVPDNEPIFKEVEQLKQQISDLNERVGILTKKLKKTTLKELKSKYEVK